MQKYQDNLSKAWNKQSIIVIQVHDKHVETHLLKRWVVVTHWNWLYEAIPMCTNKGNNICYWNKENYF